MFHFPQRALSLPLSLTHSLVLSLSFSTLAAFIPLPELRRYTTHRGRNTHRHTEVEKTHTEKRRKHIQKRNAHTHTHIQVYIYRHSGPYFRMLSAGGQRLEETQDEFSSASFHHTAMTPLFTSPIYLYNDCLPPCLACVCVCYCVCACCVGCLYMCQLKCISTFTVME